MRKGRKRSIGELRNTCGGNIASALQLALRMKDTSGKKAPKVRAGSMANPENELSYV
jgi:hypothetical protein